MVAVRAPVRATDARGNMHREHCRRCLVTFSYLDGDRSRRNGLVAGGPVRRNRCADRARCVDFDPPIVVLERYRPEARLPEGGNHLDGLPLGGGVLGLCARTAGAVQHALFRP